ncbi:lanthionine synthetase C family protein [Streptomyces morookaense]|uniref:Lanthionine synthetase C family protein n=1 Tax=Streptomyces morookaense TaxID=1970 RepID=A0A7Y7E9C7_STRMO|nr:lanthionine synthetase C family protein [Streptomyces morookaense]NVK80281.1 lanthionine synthetase C family protein [Streptomyces morookaense]GHF39991.1 hypothetical protein GCM10010359_48200 [Streptomyces morookaense]
MNSDQTSQTRTRARSVVQDVAERLADPRYVAEHTTPVPPGLMGTLLAGGHAGVALLFAELSHDDGRLRQAADAHLAACARGMKGSAARVGLFSGLAGLGFACDAVATGGGGTEHAVLRDKVRAAVDPTALRLSATVRDRLRGAGGLQMLDYDLLYGLTGVGTYLLVESISKSGAADDTVLRSVLDTLQHFDGTRDVDGIPVPAWTVGRRTPASPHGYVSLGLAHGVAGPLALMSTALLHGVQHSGLNRAVEGLAEWCLTQLRDDGQGRPAWPRLLEIDATGRAAPTAPATLLGWCYGSASVAAALHRAARALGRDDWADRARAVLLDAFRNTNDLARVTEPHLCHGWSGLLQIVLRTGTPGSPDPELSTLATTLAERLLDQYDPAAPFGFRTDLGLPHGRQDEPGFLLGAAGNALALHTYATGRPPASGWDMALLLAAPA